MIGNIQTLETSLRIWKICYLTIRCKYVLFRQICVFVCAGLSRDR